MANTTGGNTVRVAEKAGLAHRLTSRRAEWTGRASSGKGYTKGATEIGGTRNTGAHEAAARKSVKAAKMFREKLHGTAVTARVHKNRVAASRRAAKRKSGKKKAG